MVLQGPTIVVVVLWLKNFVGISDVAINWFMSYLSNRSFSLMLWDVASTHAPCFLEVPQGSMPNSFSYLPYISYPGDKSCIDIITTFIATRMIDNCMSFLKPNTTDVFCFMTCLTEIKNWMSKDFQQVNDSKSEIVIITPSGTSTSSINNLS